MPIPTNRGSSTWYFVLKQVGRKGELDCIRRLILTRDFWYNDENAEYFNLQKFIHWHSSCIVKPEVEITDFIIDLFDALDSKHVEDLSKLVNLSFHYWGRGRWNGVRRGNSSGMDKCFRIYYCNVTSLGSIRVDRAIRGNRHNAVVNGDLGKHISELVGPIELITRIVRFAAFRAWNWRLFVRSPLRSNLFRNASDLRDRRDG